MATGSESSEEHPDPVLQLLENLTREGTVVTAFQATHDKFHALHAAFLRLAPSATFDERSHDELVRALDDYAKLFDEHHRAEDNYFFPALREAEPALDPIVDQLVEQHHELSAHLAVLSERVRGMKFGGPAQDASALIEGFRELQRNVDEHLVFEEAATVPILRTWTQWPVRRTRD